MSVIASTQTSGEQLATVSSFTTASVTAHANKLQVLSFGYASGPALVSVLGTNLTWQQLAGAFSSGRSYLYYCMPTSDFTETVTITLGSNSLHQSWCWDELGGDILIGANGSNAIISTNVATGSAASATNITVTCPNAVANIASGIYGYCHCGTSGHGFTYSAGYVQVSDGSGGDEEMVTVLNAPESSLSCTFTINSGFSGNLFAAMVEVGANVYAGPHPVPRIVRQAPQRTAVR